MIAFTRTAQLGLAEEVPAKSIGLEVKRYEQQDTDRAIVEFVVCYKLNGRAQRLHEVSRFVREEGPWFYVDGGHGVRTPSPRRTSTMRPLNSKRNAISQP